MRTLLIDPFSGISGDMTVGAMLDLGWDFAECEALVASLGLEGVVVEARREERGGITGTRFQVHCPESHHHRGLGDVLGVLDGADLADEARAGAQTAFRVLAEAEGRVHGIPSDEVHFHEVGAADAIVDIACAAAGVHSLGVESVATLPVRTGSGEVEAAHGTLPVPAPATALLLEGLPVITGGDGELTTPTGAAFLAAWARPWGGGAAVVPRATGYGVGSRHTAPRPNLLRATLVDAEGPAEEVWELECQCDDLTGERAAHAVSAILEAGALDAMLIPVQMKKGRPGLLLRALADEAGRVAVEASVMAETGSLGLRRWRVERTRAPRRVTTVETEWGSVRCKVARTAFGETWSPEMDDLQRIAREQDLPLPEVERRVSDGLPGGSA